MATANLQSAAVGVIGSGRMGSDIFNFLSDFAFPLVWVCQNEEERLFKERGFFRKLDRRYANGLIDEQALASRKKLTRVSALLNDLSGCGIIIEAISENEEEKSRLFLDLEPLVPADTVIATNTSSIMPSRLTGRAAAKERFIGLHFLYPVKLKNIVELIRTDHTGDEALASAQRFLAQIGKKYLLMHERNAFVLNRILLDLQAQACRLLEDNITGVADIDAIVRDGIMPAGVFEFMDGVGIDVMHQSVLNYIESERDIEFYRPLIRVLDGLVRESRLGRKAGAGFYEYRSAKNSLKTDKALPEPERREIGLALASLFINAACRAAEGGAWSLEELECAVAEYTGGDEGPFAMIERIGRKQLVTILERYYRQTGFVSYRPSPLLEDPAQ